MTRKTTEAATPSATRANAKGSSRASVDAVPASSRATRAAERRAAIVDAAMEEFIARGFAATRLDDIAKRAGVAKGTIYLHFKDKESMFEELVRTVIVPVVTRLTAMPPPAGSVRDLVEAFASNFLKEVIGTPRTRDDRSDLAEPVCAARAARRAGHAARSSRFDFWRTEHDMRSSQAISVFALIAVLATGLAGCKDKRDPGFQGWVEADMIFVSPDEAGRVTKLNVREGDEVKVGDHLYSVDDDLQLADLNQNKATLANAQQTYDRAASLSKTGSGTQANLDSAVSALRVAEARVATSETRLSRRKGFAPVAGTIQQIYFREGEMVAAQRPVLSIMPPGNMKLRFFVPETELPKLAIGDTVRIACDNCAADLTAKIYFIATSAEYTPPVIYSLEERNKLVYLIQARPSRPDALRVGQPIDVFLNPKTPVADQR